MPVFKVQAPDGKVIKIEAADEATAIRGAKEHYASLRPRKPSAAADAGKGLLTGLAEGVAGLSDLVSQAGPLGFVDTAVKSAANVAGAMQGQAPRISNPFSGASQATARVAHKPQTMAGEYARTIGQNVPNAIAPGGVVARAVNVFAPAVASETAGQIARRGGAGQGVETAARIGGSLVGAGAASVRPQNIFRQPQDPAEAVAARARQDPATMRQRAQEYRAAGIQPTLVDVVDDAGRGMVKAAANRPTPGRDVANTFARGRALDLPSRIGGQARRNMSRDARTPDEIRDAMAARRRTNANQAFGAVRGEPIQMAPETVQALRNPMGREAIAEAARRERDPEVRAALNRLATAALDDPSTQISVGMADRISRTLFGRAQAASRAGDNDLAATFNDLATAVRDPARNASPGYGAALEGFAADSRLQEAAGVGEQLLTRNTDEFARTAGRLQPRERALALAAGRRAIERASGENISAAPGVARKLAEAPEQRARNAALMGPQRAERLQQGMRLEAEAVDNAAMIAPKRGSPTHLNDADGATASGVVQTIRSARNGGIVGVLAQGVDWLRMRGLNNEQAEALVRMATDPAQTDQAVEIIARSLGQAEAQQFIQWRNAALVGAASGATASRQVGP